MASWAKTSDQYVLKAVCAEGWDRGPSDRVPNVDSRCRCVAARARHQVRLGAFHSGGYDCSKHRGGSGVSASALAFVKRHVGPGNPAGSLFHVHPSTTVLVELVHGCVHPVRERAHRVKRLCQLVPSDRYARCHRPDACTFHFPRQNALLVLVHEERVLEAFEISWRMAGSVRSKMFLMLHAVARHHHLFQQ